MSYPLSDLAETVMANEDVFALAFFITGIASVLLVQLLRALLRRRLAGGQEPASGYDFFAVMPSQYAKLGGLVFGARAFRVSGRLTRIVILLTRISIVLLIVLGIILLAATALAPITGSATGEAIDAAGRAVAAGQIAKSYDPAEAQVRMSETPSGMDHGIKPPNVSSHPLARAGAVAGNVASTTVSNAPCPDNECKK